MDKQEEIGMECVEFARNFVKRTNHPGFKIVVNDCIDEIEQLTKARNDLETCLENAIVTIKCAYIAWEKTGSPEEAMTWIENYLWPPGLLPTDEEVEAGAQSYYDEHHAG